MVRTVGASAARRHLARLSDEAAAGETITTTKRETPVAQLVAAPPRLPNFALANDHLRAFRRQEKLSLGGIPIRALIEEGRRW